MVENVLYIYGKFVAFEIDIHYERDSDRERLSEDVLLVEYKNFI